MYKQGFNMKHLSHNLCLESYFKANKPIRVGVKPFCVYRQLRESAEYSYSVTPIITCCGEL